MLRPVWSELVALDRSRESLGGDVVGEVFHAHPELLRDRRLGVLRPIGVRVDVRPLAVGDRVPLPGSHVVEPEAEERLGAGRLGGDPVGDAHGTVLGRVRNSVGAEATPRPRGSLRCQEGSRRPTADCRTRPDTKGVVRLPAKFIEVVVVLSAVVVGVVAVNASTPARAGATGVSCSVYVANETGNSVSVIDAATNAVTATIPVGASPGGVAVSPSGTVYVANSTGNSVSVIDAATNTVTATIAVGASPDGVAVSPSGDVYVADQSGNSVSVIDGATGTVVSTVLVVGAPSSVAASASGSVYVTNSADDTVAVIDATSNTVTATIPVGAGVAFVAVSPSGTVYVTNWLTRVSVIDPVTNTVSATIGVGSISSGVAASASGTVYVTDLGNNRVSVIDGSTNHVTATIDVGTSPNGVAVSPLGTVYVTNGASDTVSVIDGSTNAVTATISVGSSPAGVAVFCPPPEPGDVMMSPSWGSTSTTPFRLELGGSGVCPAGADARRTFLVDASVDLRTVQFGEAGPRVWTPGDVGTFAQPLFDPWGNELVEYDGFADSVFIGSFAGNGRIPDGTYHLGVACTKGAAGTGQVLAWWSTSVTITGSGASWNVGTTVEPRFTG